MKKIFKLSSELELKVFKEEPLLYNYINQEDVI